MKKYFYRARFSGEITNIRIWLIAWLMLNSPYFVFEFLSPLLEKYYDLSQRLLNLFYTLSGLRWLSVWRHTAFHAPAGLYIQAILLIITLAGWNARQNWQKLPLLFLAGIGCGPFCANATWEDIAQIVGATVFLDILIYLLLGGFSTVRKQSSILS